MTRDEVIRRAREAGFATGTRDWADGSRSMPTVQPIAPGICLLPQLESFATLVAAAEGEACAKICDEMREHWMALKDAALLNGDVDLSNAASGEPRAAEALAKLIRARSAA